MSASIHDLIASFVQRLTVVEIDVAGIRFFEVRADEIGTPYVIRRAAAKWSTLTATGDEVADAVGRVARELISPDDPDPVVVLHTAVGPEQEASLRAITAWCPAARVAHPTGVKAGDLLRDLAAQVPLRQSYDLVVARERAGDGRLELAGQPLFGAGALPGQDAHATVTCTDPGGMLLAVSAWAGPLEPSGLVSVDHAPLPAGRHTLRAVLERPGQVGFPGIAGLRPHTGSWAEVVAGLPVRLRPPSPRPAHLICAIETTGAQDELEARCHWPAYLIDLLAETPTQFSIMSYGTHVFGERHPVHVPPRVVLWAGSAAQARVALESLRPAPPTYPNAAQVEDVLAELRGLLRQDGARTALLTVGARPPHPRRVGRDRVPPCPLRHDWQMLLQDLERRHGTKCAAICDGTSPVWERLGSAALYQVDAVDVEELAARLDLTSAGGSLTLPFVS
ncbi:hypothetical protein FH608_002510 [Nonomuraea phyllanthi]|uniref:Uncharacterized protein n=1 Tax=Nonomuraea phyllanthi TaxID=2219224 RepID=A0A5C4WXU3_9ACTN|nr:hypothetical protein [Nonomuraea phyllanthi]KAB8197449.1 hypothetical protein FH608_002510 [Nonomuraea phyllanthi]